jgi:hypothetical protein
MPKNPLNVRRRGSPIQGSQRVEIREFWDTAIYGSVIRIREQTFKQTKQAILRIQIYIAE